MSTPKKLLARHLQGLYIYPDGHKGMTFSYAQLIYKCVWSDGSTSTEYTRPLYEHEVDGGPEWRTIWPALAAMWRPTIGILEKVDAERRSKHEKEIAE